MQPFEWQNEAVERLQNSHSLLVRAPPGSGKSLVGKISSEITGSSIVIVHNLDMIEQWQREYGMTAITIQSAIKMNIINSSLVILDECHHYESPVWSSIYNIIDADYILGLSATPGNSTRRFKEVYTVNWDEIRIPNYTFNYHSFQLDSKSMMEYRELTDRIKNVSEDDSLDLREQEQLLLNLSVKRRRVTHNSINRYNELIRTIPMIKGRKALLVFETIDMCDKVCDALVIKRYHSYNKDSNALDEFTRCNLDIIGSVKMLKEGYNNPNIDTVIVASSALSETHIVQVLGRGLRFSEGKHVDFHIFVASGTTDENLIGLAEGILQGRETTELNDYKYKRGEQYSLAAHGHWIFKTVGYDRYYFEKTGLEEEIWRIKPGGGRFRIYENEILVKDKDGNIVSVGKVERLIPKPSAWLTESKINYHDLFG